MSATLRRLAVPAYLLLCIVLGGSIQAIYGNMALQLLAVVIIAWAAIAPGRKRKTKASSLLVGLVIFALLLIVLQLVPLPASIWTALPGRDPIASGYHTLGQDLPPLPLSVAPYATLATATTLLPPIAVLVGMMRLRAHGENLVAGAVLAGTFLGVLLAAVQVASGRATDGWWYLYDITNTGAVGFFANSNHMATLLLVAMPFAVALFASGQSQTSERRRIASMAAIGVASFLLILVGLVLNRSLAAAGLAIPVIAASALLLPAGWRWRRLSIPAAAITLIGALVLLTNSPIQAELGGADTTSIHSRQAMWRTTAAAVADSLPVGTGVGTFEQVYPLYERPETVQLVHVNHAHNDYLELLLETGLPGAVLVLLFLLWWVRQTVQVWRSPLSTHFAKAATIASAAVLAHSIVDYPLRTAAIAALFSSFLAMMAQPARQRQTGEPSDLRPTRHVKVG